LISKAAIAAGIIEYIVRDTLSDDTNAKGHSASELFAKFQEVIDVDEVVQDIDDNEFDQVIDDNANEESFSLLAKTLEDITEDHFLEEDVRYNHCRHCK
jgi:hypothetical protein